MWKKHFYLNKIKRLYIPINVINVTFFQSLDEKDIALLKSYGQGQYTKALKVILLL